MSTNAPQTSFQDILDQNKPKTSEEKKNENLSKTIGENNGLTDDMKADLTAMGLDLVSAGSAFAPGYGTAVSAVTGIGATISGAVADRMRGESWGSTLGTAGFGLSMDILGLIPGLGVAGKASKIARVVSKGAKWIGPALGGLAAMSYGPGALSAYKKFTSGKSNDVTAEELRDFTYAIRAIASGGIRKAGSTYQGNRTLARAQKEGKVSFSTEKTPASITTKNGKKVNLSDEEFKTLSGNGSRQSKIDLLKSKGIKEEDIDWKGLNPVKGNFKTTSKSSKVSGLEKGSEQGKLKWNTTKADYKGIRRFSNENFLRNYTQMGGFNSGIWNTIKNKWAGQDILNSGNISSSTKTSNNSNLKLLPNLNPLVKDSPISKTINVSPYLNINPKSEFMNPTNYKTKMKEFPQSVKELQVFQNAYFGKGTMRNSGYGDINYSNPEKSIKAGELVFELPGGKKISFKVSKEELKNASPNKINEIRLRHAKQIQDLIKQEPAKVMGPILKDLKKAGFLKQGGTIDKQKIQKYKEYIKK